MWYHKVLCKMNIITDDDVSKCISASMESSKFYELQNI